MPAPSTRAKFIVKIQGVCAARRAKLDAVSEPEPTTTLATRYAAQAAEYGGFIRQLERLHVPSEVSVSFRTYLRTIRRSRDVLNRVADSARSRDASVLAELGADLSTDFKARVAAAIHLGAEVCGL